MKHKLFFLAIMLTIPGIVFGTEQMSLSSYNLFEFKELNTKSIKSDILNGIADPEEFIPIKLKNQIFDDILNNKPENLNITAFPIAKNKSIDFDLVLENTPSATKTKIFIHNESGKKQIVAPNSVMYCGKIRGEANSFVSMVYSNNMLFAYIKHEDGTVLSIEPVKEANSDLHFLSPHLTSSEIVSDNPPSTACYTPSFTGDKTEIEDNIIHKNDELQSSSELFETNIICDGTSEFYAMMGKDVEKTTAFIQSVMFLVSKIYVENVNVRLIVSEIHIRETEESDPYIHYKTLDYKLMEMFGVWYEYPEPRAVVVLFANLNAQLDNVRIAGISMGGEPNRGSICDEWEGYCVLGIKKYSQYPTFQYTWSVKVAAHEIGHNFGAPHTHNCYFAPNMLDTCVTRDLDACVEEGPPIPRPGTIMSYCHTTNATHSVELIFHPRMKPLIRKAAERASCVHLINTRMIELVSPLGENKLRSGEVYDIRWSSANVNAVNVFLSLDNGNTWELKGSPVIAAESSHLEILVPHLITDSARVKIIDVENSKIYDESVLPFTISYQEFTFEYPVGGESFGNKESFYVLWKQNFDDDIKLDFTSDGGKTWSNLTQQTDQFYYFFEIPDIESENCKLRITSLFDGSITESNTFSVGEPSATILAPNGGEKLFAKDKFTIKWESHNMTECILEYSKNNGSSWNRINFGKTDANAKEYEWTVTTQLSDSALIRIKAATGDQISLDESDNMFEVVDKDVYVEEDTVNYEDRIHIAAITPNPLNDRTTAKIVNPTEEDELCEVMIVDGTGKIFSNTKNLLVTAGSEYLHEVKVGELSQGSYFIVLRSSKTLNSYPIKIIR